MNMEVRQVIMKTPFKVNPVHITENMEADIGAGMAELAINEGGNNLKFRDCGPAVTKMTDNQRNVLALLSDRPMKTIDITNQVGLTNDTTGYTLSALCKRGLAKRHPKSNRNNVYWVKA